MTSTQSFFQVLKVEKMKKHDVNMCLEKIKSSFCLRNSAGAGPFQRLLVTSNVWGCKKVTA